MEKYDPHGNEFSNWYYERIRGVKNKEEQERVIKENPILALRVINVFSDKALGRKFIDTYKDHPKLSHVAYLVAREIGHRFAHDYLEAQKVEVPFAQTGSLPSYCYVSEKGNEDAPNSEYWWTNAWDNVVKTLEDSVQ
ncbi:hypothetical protein HYV49_00705 [Candidatus Pacearchaeota archaeon]|nr:hypothetical protein [Candidatus Pacearchaeota archaeon]